jgi:hypothetical protein
MKEMVGQIFNNIGKKKIFLKPQKDTMTVKFSPLVTSGKATLALNSIKPSSEKFADHKTNIDKTILTIQDPIQVATTNHIKRTSGISGNSGILGINSTILTTESTLAKHMRNSKNGY